MSKRISTKKRLKSIKSFISESGNKINSPTLVLNRSWRAIDATTAKHAFTDVSSGKAKFVCPDTFQMYDLDEWLSLDVKDGTEFIQTVHKKVRIPELIVNTYDKIPKQKVVFSRKNLWIRDSERCQYCGIKPEPDCITIDHVVPKSRGGKTTFTNCVLACLKCNTKKDNMTPEEAGMGLISTFFINGVEHKEKYYRPKHPEWNPIYKLRRKRLPPSWKHFIKDIADDLYWNTPLEP